jgi:hypothetical protein
MMSAQIRLSPPKQKLCCSHPGSKTATTPKKSSATSVLSFLAQPLPTGSPSAASKTENRPESIMNAILHHPATEKLAPEEDLGSKEWSDEFHQIIHAIRHPEPVYDDCRDEGYDWDAQLPEDDSDLGNRVQMYDRILTEWQSSGLRPNFATVLDQVRAQCLMDVLAQICFDGPEIVEQIENGWYALLLRLWKVLGKLDSTNLTTFC